MGSYKRCKERKKISRSNGRCQEVTKDNIPSREDQECHRNEDPSSKRKSSVGTKDRIAGLVGAPTEKGKTVGHGNRRSERMHRTYRLGGR
jgi:hypothetical protein